MENQLEQTSHEEPAQLASKLMKRGIALLENPSSEALVEALDLFDRALEIRLGLSDSSDAWSGYVLAASWMNRADALTKIGTAANLPEAIRSYDEALTVLNEVPLDANPLYRRRFAIAWLNRGISLQAQGTDLIGALQSFENGLDALRGMEGEEILAASGCMNRANLLVTMDHRASDARQSAERAIALVAAHERVDLIAAEIGLKARHILCRALATIIGDTVGQEERLISTAVGTVQSGLELARVWEQHGETRFRELAFELFRFGALANQRHQPAALVGFLQKNLESTADGMGEDALIFHRVARETLVVEWQRLQSEGFSAINTPRLEQWIETLRALRETEEKLRTIREGDVPPKTSDFQQG